MGKKASKKEKKSPKDKDAANNNKNDEDEDQETRFDASKPQFRESRHAATTTTQKVVLDERFASVLSDPKFQINARDKYGRKNKKKSSNNAKNELGAFYEIVKNGDTEDEDEKLKDTKNNNATRNKPQSDTDDESSLDDDDDKKATNPLSRIAYLTALSRGELDVSSSSSDEESDTNDEDNQSQSSNDEDGSDVSSKEDDFMGKAGILDPSHGQQDYTAGLSTTDDESPYLAVMNMDWSHVRAVDIFAVVSSFVAPGGVQRVAVYASDFGMERMEKEERFGPTNLWKKKRSSSSQGRRQGGDDLENDNDDVFDNEPQDRGFDQDALESDFDVEKLREYEASRLKYFFAIVQMVSSNHADTVYKEVDGMEFEHSSAGLDVRSVPVDELPNITASRPLRDEATSIPSNYEPPDFVVTALQQTNVQCTWEAGDRERERTLTKYATSGQDWRDIAQSDDIRAYLASDASSDDDDEEGEDTAHSAKASNMRKMLGLDSDDDDDDDENDNKSDFDDEERSDDENDDNLDQSESFLTFDGETDDNYNNAQDKEVAFVPGTEKLEDKIRSAIEKKKSGLTESTPWEEYLEKKKQKRKERKAAARARREEINQARRGKKDSKISEKEKMEPSQKVKQQQEAKKAQAELELLAADGEGDDEAARDFDMRGLQRIEQNKYKKLKGARKRKEATLEANVVGTDFKVDMADSRFKAVLDGADDRFGIDLTDPQYKETPGMREIMAEQTRRRKKQKTKPAPSVAPDVKAGSVDNSKGASALSSLVSRLKQKVAN